jgi:hypothetical protein
MTERSARTLANVTLGVAGAAAAYVVLTTPPLRRFALRAVRLWLGASLPVYLAGQVRDAWVQSRDAA